jgi:hypothetical protein
MTLIRKVKQTIFGSKIPKKSTQSLERKGGDKIANIFILRRPIEKYVDKLLKVATLGQIDKAIKEAGVRDKLLHIALVINGYIYELNEILSLGLKQYTKQENDELLKVVPTPDKTITEFIMKAQERGGDAFYNYDPITNNCGEWVKNVLKANGLLKTEYKAFINQNAAEIFQKLGVTSKPVQAITELGALVAEIKNLFD